MVTRLQGGAQGSTDYKHSRHVRIFSYSIFSFRFVKPHQATGLYLLERERERDREAVPENSWLLTADCTSLQQPPSQALQDCSSLLSGLYEICGVHQAFCTVFCQAADSTLWRRESKSTNKQGLSDRNWHRSLCSGVRTLQYTWYNDISSHSLSPLQLRFYNYQ